MSYSRNNRTGLPAIRGGGSSDTTSITGILKGNGSVISAAIPGTDYVTGTSTNTLTNKTLNSATNYIDANALHTQVFNNSGGGVTPIQALYEVQWNNGANAPEVSKAIATSVLTCAAGLSEDTIADGGTGSMRTHGLLENVNTSIWSDNTILYLSPTVAGGLTSTKPVTVGQYVQVIGRVVRQHATLGVVAVHIGDPVLVSASSYPAKVAFSATFLNEDTTQTATITDTSITATSVIVGSVDGEEAGILGLNVNPVSRGTGTAVIQINAPYGATGTYTGYVSVI